MTSSSERPFTRRAGCHQDGEIKGLDCDRVETRPQYRTTVDPEKQQRMTESIRKHGQETPGKVYWDPAVKVYVVVFGHCRFAACKELGITFRAEILDREPDAADVLDMQLRENSHRSNPNQLDRARAVARTKELRGFKHNKQLAEHLDESESTISDLLAVLELPEEAQEAIARGAGVSATIRRYSKKPRRAKGHGKKRGISLGGGRTLTLTARKPIEDEVAWEMLTAALALLPRPELRIAETAEPALAESA